MFLHGSFLTSRLLGNSRVQYLHKNLHIKRFKDFPFLTFSQNLSSHKQNPHSSAMQTERAPQTSYRMSPIEITKSLRKIAIKIEIKTPYGCFYNFFNLVTCGNYLSFERRRNAGTFPQSSSSASSFGFEGVCTIGGCSVEDDFSSANIVSFSFEPPKRGTLL